MKIQYRWKVLGDDWGEWKDYIEPFAGSDDAVCEIRVAQEPVVSDAASRYTQEQTDRIVALRKQGNSYYEISDKTGIVNIGDIIDILRMRLNEL